MRTHVGFAIAATILAAAPVHGQGPSTTARQARIERRAQARRAVLDLARAAVLGRLEQWSFGRYRAADHTVKLTGVGKLDVGKPAYLVTVFRRGERRPTLMAGAIIPRRLTRETLGELKLGELHYVPTRRPPASMYR